MRPLQHCLLLSVFQYFAKIKLKMFLNFRPLSLLSVEECILSKLQIATGCLVWCSVHNNKAGHRLQLSNCFLRSGKFKRPLIFSQFDIRMVKLLIL